MHSEYTWIDRENLNFETYLSAWVGQEEALALCGESVALNSVFRTTGCLITDSFFSDFIWIADFSLFKRTILIRDVDL